MIRSLQNIFKDERRPVRIQSDQREEFTYREFLKAFKSIHFFTTHKTKTKASIEERFQRTLKARMWRYFTRNKTRLYVDILPDLVYAYNHIIEVSRELRFKLIQPKPCKYGKLCKQNTEDRPAPRFHVGD